MMLNFERATLGRTGIEVVRLGVAASYGVPAAAVEKAVERGVNYLYWGSLRRSGFGDAIRRLAPSRERFVLVLQSYSRLARLIPWSVERALRSLSLDYADLLLLGMWNRGVPPRILDAAREARRRGLVRALAVSTHRRVLVPGIAAADQFDVVHFRYNAAHPGAERDIFPHLPAPAARPGLVAFTATSHGALLKRFSAADCYRFVLSRPEVDVCLTGPANAAQMDAALEALRLGPLDEDQLQRMRRIAGG